MTNRLVIVLLLFQIHLGFGQIASNSLTGIYVGEHWDSWDWPTAHWTKYQNDTLRILSVDSATCYATTSTSSWYLSHGTYYSAYYSCTGTPPSNNYLYFHHTDSLSCKYDFLWTGSLFYSNRFYGRKIPGTTFGIKNEHPINIQISIWPNPASETLTVTSVKEIGSLKIINTFGQVVFQILSTQEREQINITQLAAGIYFVQTAAGSAKFIKE